MRQASIKNETFCDILLATTPGVDFINVLQFQQCEQLFCVQIPKAQKENDDLAVFLCFRI